MGGNSSAGGSSSGQMNPGQGAGYSGQTASDPTGGGSHFMQQISSQKQATSQGGAQSPGVGSSGSGMGGGLGSENEAKLQVTLTPAERDTIIKQNGFRSAMDVTRKLNDIKNERKGLRTQLD